MAFAFRLGLCFFCLWFGVACEVSNTGRPDTLTFRLPDSLKVESGKYDSVRLDLYSISGKDTVFEKTLFEGPYRIPSQLESLPLVEGLDGRFLVRVTGYLQGRKILDLGVAFRDGEPGKTPIVYSAPRDTAPAANRPPRVSVVSPDTGREFRIMEGDTLFLRVQAMDPDSGDRVQFLPLAKAPWLHCGSGTYDPATGLLTFIPGFRCAEIGEVRLPQLAIRVSDNAPTPATAEIVVNLTVVDVNTAPKWRPGDIPLQGKEGRSLTLDLTPLYRGDAEGDSVVISASCGTVSTTPLQWQLTPGFRDSGPKLCTLTATDSHTPPASSHLILSLTIEDSVRVVDVAILSPLRGSLFRDSIISVAWQVDSLRQTRDTMETLRKEGKNVIRRNFTDSLGNQGSDTVTVVLDTKPPLKPMVQSKGWTNNAKPRWSWKGGGGGNGWFRVRIDTLASDQGGTVVHDTAYTAPWNLSPGRHVLYVQERDEAGNWSPTDSGTALVDLSPPVVAITSPRNGHVTNQGAVEVSWTVDATPQTPFIQVLKEGDTEVTRSAVDSAGNQATATLTITRRSQVIFVNAAAAAVGDGNSWATAAKTLQAGLAKAQNGWEIWAAKGTYRPDEGVAAADTSFVLKAGLSMYGGFSGTENARDRRDWKKNVTILGGKTLGPGQANELGQPIIMDADNARLDGFSIENGKSYLGSGMSIKNDLVIVNNCVFRNNSGSSQEGGGAIQIYGSKCTISNSEFIGNSNSSGAGAIAVLGQETNISDCKFMTNRSTSGGAIEIDRYSSASISKSIFQNNIAEYSGGAISHRGSIIISNSFFLENSAGGGGGAIFSQTGYLTLSNCVFARNTTESEGGALNNLIANASGINLTFFGNSAKGNGGAVYQGSAASSSTTLLLKNSVIWNNATLGSGPQIAVDPAATAQTSVLLSYSIVEGGIEKVYKPVSVDLNSSLGIIAVDPKLRNPANPAGTDGLLMTSDDGLSPEGGPAINSGNLIDSPSNDITGSSRPKGGLVDIGAYEP